MGDKLPLFSDPISITMTFCHLLCCAGKALSAHGYPKSNSHRSVAKGAKKEVFVCPGKLPRQAKTFSPFKTRPLIDPMTITFLVQSPDPDWIRRKISRWDLCASAVN